MQDRQSVLYGFLLIGVLLVAACGPAPVPNPSIATAAYYQQPARLEQAWRQPVAATYRDHFEYQHNAAFCGPATVINVFRSLGIDHSTQDGLFDRAQVSYWKARFLGLTLDELAEVIRVNAPLKVTVLRDLTREVFQHHLHRANHPAYRYVINFNRQPLFGVNMGHHSPIGGYLPDADLVFVLDVLDRYQPFLVPAHRLYAAMNTIDAETGKKRGLLLIEAMPPTTTTPLEVETLAPDSAPLPTSALP